MLLIFKIKLQSKRFEKVFNEFLLTQIYFIAEIFCFIWHGLPVKMCYNAYYFLISTRRTFAMSTKESSRRLDKVRIIFYPLK